MNNYIYTWKRYSSSIHGGMLRTKRRRWSYGEAAEKLFFYLWILKHQAKYLVHLRRSYIDCKFISLKPHTAKRLFVQIIDMSHVWKCAKTPFSISLEIFIFLQPNHEPCVIKLSNWCIQIRNRIQMRVT